MLLGSYSVTTTFVVKLSLMLFGEVRLDIFVHHELCQVLQGRGVRQIVFCDKTGPNSVKRHWSRLFPLVLLPRDQLGEEAVLLHQLVVGPILDDLPLVEDDDPVALADRGQTVCDHEPGAV